MIDVRSIESKEILKTVLDFKRSGKYDEMLDGENYFKCKNDILKRNFYYYPNQVKAKDPYRANNKIVDNYFRLLVEQKVAFCMSKDVVISGYVPTFNINDFIDIIAEESSIKGIGWACPYIDNLKSLKFAIIPAEEVVGIFDSTIEKNLLYAIRFFEQDKTMYIEVSDTMNTLYYKKNEKNELELLQTVQHNWGKVPFIQLKNNRFEMSDLDNIKSLIDSYDKTISDFANNFEDMQDVYYKIKNYAGSVISQEDISVIMESLKQHKIINVDKDGDFEAVQLEIPYTARETYLRMIRQLIFLFGQGVDTDDLAGGSLTNVAIQAKFSNLEQKCNKFLKYVKRFIENCLYFDIKYKNNSGNPETNIKNLDIVFNTSLFINETETIDNFSTSNNMISKETNLSNHPWVNDVEEELKKIAEDELSYNEPMIIEEGVDNDDIEP